MSPAPRAPIETSLLDSGIVLVTETMPDVASVAVGFWVGTGSRDEPVELAGASHFLEHLLFKGTPSRSAAAIAEALDEVGGDCNAFTTKEYTSFYVRLLADHLDLGLDILADIMWDPALSEEDTDAERNVILDEILMHTDEPQDLAAELSGAALFPGHPLGRDPLGTPESIAALTSTDIREFFDAHYLPGNIVVSAAGDCDHGALAASLEARLAGRPGGGAPQRLAPSAPPEPLVVTTRPTEQAHLVLGVPAVGRSDPTRFAWSVLNHVLGGGLSSRLFRKVREERGLAYSIWSERSAYEETGSLSVMAGTAPEHVAELLSIVVAELEMLSEDGITDRELAIAKGNLRAELLLSDEDSGARMHRLGFARLVHGAVPSLEELLERIDAVERAEVLEAARLAASAPRTLAAVGPFAADVFDRTTLGLAPTVTLDP